MKIFFTILITAFFLSGCNYELREIPKSNANTETSQTNEDKKTAETGQTAAEDDEGIEGGELLITDTGRQGEINCKNREVEFDKDTTSNSITFKGVCKKITVDGVANKVFAEEVGQIIVRGVSNKVTYESGIGGGKPKISVTGISTSAKKKEAEAKTDSEEPTERKPKE